MPSSSWSCWSAARNSLFRGLYSQAHSEPGGTDVVPADLDQPPALRLYCDAVVVHAGQDTLEDALAGVAVPVADVDLLAGEALVLVAVAKRPLRAG